MLNTQEKIKDWLDENNIINYVINDDLTVDITKGDLDLANRGLKTIPIQFGRVDGTVYLGMNELESLKGSPYYIKGHLNCENNKLNNFDDCPQYIGGIIICSFNPIESLRGFNCDLKEKLFHSSYKDDLHKIKELEHMYKISISKDQIWVSVSKDEIDKILSYTELNESLEPNNKVFMKKIKL